MCGIVGIVEPSGRAASPETVGRMCDRIRHRGPDSSGVHLDGRTGLGVRRLSIVDLETGDQPLASEDETVWVVHNGEIYNHAALRRELEELGHRFRTDHSDTEVLVHAWEEWGVEAPRRLNGMFAFAVWDGARETLLLVRDRIGIKPLYYWWRDGRLVFASEIKALLEHPAVGRELDPASLFDYLGWEFVPAPRTMFDGVRKLGPGQLLRWRDGEISVESWWDLEYAPREGSRQEFADGVLERLRDSVGRRLMADVPLGVFLSGGLDSTAVVALAAEQTDERIPTFTIGYDRPSFSEWEHARHAADYYGTEHHEIMIEPITPELIERCVWHLDEPMTDLSAMPFHILARAARERVKVALSGEGGDEVFVGYDRFVASKIDRAYRILPRLLREGVVAPLARRLPEQPQKKGLINMFKRFVQGSSYPADVGAMRWQYFSSPEQDRRLFAPELLERVETDRFEALRAVRDGREFPCALDRELYVDLRFTMPASVLMKVDKMSMATSLEVRVPFLDHALVEYAAGIPACYRFPGLRRRAIYREAVRSILPPKILERGKQGYSLPIKNWLREELRDWMIELFDESELIRRYLRPEAVDAIVAEHLDWKANHNHVLWALINAELWHRAYIQERAPEFARGVAS